MKTKKVASLLLAAVMSMVAFGVASPAHGQPTTEKLTSKQVRALIATAKTPEDHQKIADFYRAAAETAKANAAEHERILAAYYQNPSTHEAAKAAGGPSAHCHTLINLFNEEAKEDLALADEHEKMAKGTTN